MHLFYNCRFGQVRQEENILLLCLIHAQRWATATLKKASLPLSLFAENNSSATPPITEQNSSELSLPLLLVNF